MKPRLEVDILEASWPRLDLSSRSPEVPQSEEPVPQRVLVSAARHETTRWRNSSVARTKKEGYIRATP